MDATPNITHDLYPTVLEMTGIAAQKSVVDGVSLAPLLKTGAKVERDALYWHYPHYHGGGATPHSAIRKGDFRLIHFYEDDRDELYDLAHDIGETKDLAAAQPGVVQRPAQVLRALAHLVFQECRPLELGIGGATVIGDLLDPPHQDMGDLQQLLRLPLGRICRVDQRVDHPGPPSGG